MKQRIIHRDVQCLIYYAQGLEYQSNMVVSNQGIKTRGKREIQMIYLARDTLYIALPKPGRFYQTYQSSFDRFNR